MSFRGKEIGLVVIVAVSISVLTLFDLPSMAGDKPPRREPPYVFGVFPAVPLTQLEGLFSPLAAEIGVSLNRAVRFQTSSTYDLFSERLRNGEFDIALIHPFDFIKNAEKAGYIPLVRKNEDLSAVFVVSEQSPVDSIRDLKGGGISMPPEGSAVSILAHGVLADGGIKEGRDLEVRHFEGHNSALQQVLINTTQAALTCRTILRMFEERMGVKLRVIEESAPISHSIVAVHSRVLAGDRAIIRKTLLETTFSGVSPEFKKGFVIEGKKTYVPLEEADLRAARSYLLRIWKSP